MKAVLLILLGVLIALGTLMESMFTLAFIGVCARDLKHGEHDIGVTQEAISQVLRGKAKTSGGYHWKYAPESDNKRDSYYHFPVLNDNN